MIYNSNWTLGNRRLSSKLEVWSNNAWFNIKNSVDGDIVKSFEYEESCCNNAVTLGCANASHLTLQMINLSPQQLANFSKGAKLRVTLFCDFGTVEQANSQVINSALFIDSIEASLKYTGRYDAKIEAYDPMMYLDKNCTIAPPNGYVQPADLIATILTACNVDFTSVHSSWTNNYMIRHFGMYMNEIPQNITYRQYVGYLASMLGGYARFDENGELVLEWFEKPVDSEGDDVDFTIDASKQYMSGLALSTDKPVRFDTVETGTAEQTYHFSGESQPSAYYNLTKTMSFENPIITRTKSYNTSSSSYSPNDITSILTRLWENVLLCGYFDVFPSEVRWRGNPTIRIGSKLQCEHYNSVEYPITDFYVMKRVMHYDGGLYENYYCYGNNAENTVVYNPSSLTKNLEHSVSVLEEAIESATSAIEQTQGSVFELIAYDGSDPSMIGKNTGFMLYDPDREKYIKGTSAGIQFYDGNSASLKGAMYWDGGTLKIVANSMAAGSITADMIDAGQIYNRHLTSECVEADNIRAGAITADKIDLGTVANNLASAYYHNQEPETNGFMEFTEFDDTMSKITVTQNFGSGTKKSCKSSPFFAKAGAVVAVKIKISSALAGTVSFGIATLLEPDGIIGPGNMNMLNNIWQSGTHTLTYNNFDDTNSKYANKDCYYRVIISMDSAHTGDTIDEIICTTENVGEMTVRGDLDFKFGADIKGTILATNIGLQTTTDSFSILSGSSDRAVIAYPSIEAFGMQGSASGIFIRNNTPHEVSEENMGMFIYLDSTNQANPKLAVRINSGEHGEWERYNVNLTKV